MRLLAVCMCMALAALTASEASAVVRRDRGAEIVKGFPGLASNDMERKLRGILAEGRDEHYVVTKVKLMKALMENARLQALRDDVFVDEFCDRWFISRFREERFTAFAKATPGLEDTWDWWKSTHGGYVSHIDPTHTCPDWESLLQLGFPGVAQRARKRLETAKTAKEREFLGCVAEVYDAICAFCRRWADAAETAGAKDCAAVLRELAAHEPRTLREGLQLMLVYTILQDAEGEPVRSQGLFDRNYIGLYRADLAAGRETRESAKALVRELFLKFYRQGHPNGMNIAFGGYGRDGQPVWNELTEIGFELHHELNHVNPKLTYRFGGRTPHEQLLKVTRCLAAGRTSVVFFNDDVAREMFVRRGKDPADAADAVLIGCYEPGIQGREVIASMSAWVNMVKPMEAAFNGGRGFDGYPVGPVCGLPKDYAAFEAEYLRQLEAMVSDALAKTRLYEEHWYELNPSPIMSGQFRDAVANARDAYDGGMKYNQSGVMLAGMATVADSLAAVRYLVDEEKLVTLPELAAILRGNWEGHEELRLKARRSPPKWGNNDDRADRLGKMVYDRMAKLVNGTRNGHGGTFQAGFWSIDDDMKFGALTGATPEGRKAGETISRNNVATAGCGREGATALALTNVKLDQAESPDGHILDVILPVSADREGAAERVAAFIETYAKLGGQTIHLNLFDAATLRDAQRHPEKYEDLQVRVCGWNVRWNDLSRAEQDHFIMTAEAQK